MQNLVDLIQNKPDFINCIRSFIVLHAGGCEDVNRFHRPRPAAQPRRAHDATRAPAQPQLRVRRGAVATAEPPGAAASAVRRRAAASCTVFRKRGTC